MWFCAAFVQKHVITTFGQPFVLDTQSNGLLEYRTVSLMYMFSVEGENDGNLGLTGHVFRPRVARMGRDVEYYSCKEYPRLNDALHYNKTNFGPEVDKVCKALEMLTCGVLATPGQSITYKRGRGVVPVTRHDGLKQTSDISGLRLGDNEATLPEEPPLLSVQ
ncbi:hypothetical protein IFM89_024574, partial [Coptis chinensis]